MNGFGTLALLAAAGVLFGGCSYTGSGGSPGSDLRRATVSAVDPSWPIQSVRISHYHGATVVRDVALAPADLALRSGDRVIIDHAARPPVVLFAVPTR